MATLLRVQVTGPSKLGYICINTEMHLCVKYEVSMV